MRAMEYTALCAAAVLGLAGCEGENLFANTDVVLVSAPAAFDAVVFEFENRAGDRIDVIDEGGRFGLVLDDEAGEFESDFTHRGTTLRRAGTFETVDDRITFSDDPFADDDRELERSFDFVRSDDAIFMEDPSAVFDVDGDGEAEVATLRIRLEPRG